MDALLQLKTALSDRYDVEREVGAGGMATVYLARDMRHDRQVALKVLRPELGAVLGVERFLAEIRVTANLQHPNILPLFDSGEANGLLFYVMPFVVGETLRARLEREKQLPVDEAIGITRAIANALDYAHAANVIHRDLKPESILFQAGQPVLADFGIALAVANAGGARITQTGLSLGTPQYMSPEQATGDRVIDGRTDLYSLAAVLYEMLTGEPPHTGSTAQAIIARVLTEKPRSIRSTRGTVPAYVEAAIERALAKLPADRFGSSREFAQALGSGFATAPVGSHAASAPDIRVSLSISRASIARTAKWTGIAAAVAIGAWGWLRKPVEVREPRMRFTIEVPDSLAPVSSNLQQSLVISPDGSELVYPAMRGGPLVMRRRLDGFAVTAVAESQGAQNPRYSHDGTWLALEVNGKLFKVPLAGGPRVTIADSVLRQSWGDDGTIVYARTNNGGLWRVSDAGGTPARVTALDTSAGDALHTWPHVLPGGTGVLFQIGRRGSGVIDDELAVASLPDGRITRLGIKGTNPRYARSGHLLFARLDGTVSAAPFDLRARRVTGPAVTVLEGIVVKTGGAAMYAVSSSGTLAYIEGSSEFHVVAVEPGGRRRNLTPALGRFSHARMSPAGDRLALEITDGARIDVWILALATGQYFRLTRDGKSRSPEWTPDGRRIAWVYVDSLRERIRVQAADGSGAPRNVESAFTNILELSPSPQAPVVAVVGGVSGERDVSLVTLDGATPERKLLSSDGSELAPSISPDGKWIAFQTFETGRAEVYVASIANPATRLQVSSDGASEAMWAPGGRALTYRVQGNMVKTTLSLEGAFSVTRRDTLFTDSFIPGRGSEREYDVDRRTGQFIMLNQGNQVRERIVVVTGWLDELRERMAGATRR